MRTTIKLFILTVLSYNVYIYAMDSHFHISKTGCRKTKGCISFPDSCTSSDNCDYLVTYKTENNSVAFELSSKNEYAGFGLNTKQAMDGTDAIVCSKKVSGNLARVGHYLLHHHNRPTISKPTPAGLTKMVAAYVNGRIVCRFKRSYNATPPMKYNLKYDYFFIYSRGKISDTGNLTFHLWKSYSKEKYSMAFRGPVQEENKDLLVAIHAGFMLAAWIGFASIGMFTARYTKILFGKQTCCDLKLWFQLHRGCMAVTTLLTIAGVVVIFIYVNGWSQIAGWHAIIGIAVVSLATIQPLIAMLRPREGSPKRYIFNGLHRLIAVVVFVLAITNCYLGLDLFNKPPLTNHLGFCVLSSLMVTFLVVVLLYEIYVRFYHTKLDEENTSLLNNKTDISYDHITKSNRMIGMAVYLFIILAAIGICATFIVLLVLATMKEDQG